MVSVMRIFIGRYLRSPPSLIPTRTFSSKPHHGRYRAQKIFTNQSNSCEVHLFTQCHRSHYLIPRWWLQVVNYPGEVIVSEMRIFIGRYLRYLLGPSPASPTMADTYLVLLQQAPPWPVPTRPFSSKPHHGQYLPGPSPATPPPPSHGQCLLGSSPATPLPWPMPTRLFSSNPPPMADAY